jgi:hypothetical protein
VSLWKRGDIWHYDFWFLGRRYFGSTRQTTRGDANACEQEVKRRVRRQAAGLEGPTRGGAPRFQTGPRCTFASAASTCPGRSFSKTTSGSSCASGAHGRRRMIIPTIPITTSAFPTPSVRDPLDRAV